ncbi:MAG: hypothetical protein K1Y36_09400 [Blastocatellia bacterium]|nr:hypothetical protein [Blastocatellia bacterium]
MSISFRFVRNCFLGILLLAGWGLGEGVPAQTEAKPGMAVKKNPSDFTLVGPVGVKIDAPTGESRHGYLEYRVTIVSYDPQRHLVTLNFPKENARYGSLRQLTRSIVVEPFGQVSFSLFQPGLKLDFPGGIGVLIDGQVRDEMVSLSAVQHGADTYSYSRTVGPPILLSRGASVTSVPDFEAAGQKFLTNSDGKVNFNAIRVPGQVSEWSGNWLGYSRYDAVVVTDADVESMPVQVKGALLQYVSAGGVLIHFGTQSLTGLVQATGTSGRFSLKFLGFGVIAQTNTSLADLDEAEWAKLERLWLQTGTPFTTMKNPGDANQAFPVVPKFGIPLRTLFLVMLVFVVLIGPVNISILTRKKMRILLLATVPALSLLTCLLVATVALFSEGFASFGRCETLTILDERTHQAATIGWTAYYSPLTRGEGLHFSTETEVTPQVYAGYYYRDGSANRTIDWTEDQHLDSGWLQARVPSHFLVRKSEIRRERLTIQPQADGTVSITNALGAGIKEIWYARSDGKILHGKNIPAGKPAPLIFDSHPPATTYDMMHPLFENGDAAKFRQLYTWDWTGLVWNCSQDPGKVLRPNTYLAILDNSPFVEEGNPKITKHNNSSVVFGIVGGEGQ